LIFGLSDWVSGALLSCRCARLSTVVSGRGLTALDVQAGTGGPIAAVNRRCQAVAQGQAVGSRSRLRRAERVTRAAMLISWVRMVAVLALACIDEASAPAARVRLNAIAASTSQAELAANRPEGRQVGERAVLQVGDDLFDDGVAAVVGFGFEHRQWRVGEDRVVAPGWEQLDNGREFIADTVVQFLADHGVTAAFIEKGSPQQNCYVERFNGTMRRELLNAEIFHSLTEARVLIHGFVHRYNHDRPHRSLGMKSPARFAAQWHALNHTTKA
jgi:Integrase core domain